MRSGLPLVWCLTTRVLVSRALETDAIPTVSADYFLYEVDAGRQNIGSSLAQAGGQIAFGYAGLGDTTTGAFDLTQDGIAIEWDARLATGLPATGSAGGVLVSVADGTTAYASPQSLSAYALDASSSTWDPLFQLLPAGRSSGVNGSGSVGLLLPPPLLPTGPSKSPTLAGGNATAASAALRPWVITAVAVASSIRQHAASLAAAARSGSPPPPYPATSSTPAGVTPAALLVACSAPALINLGIPAYSWVSLLSRVPATAPACPQPAVALSQPASAQNVVDPSVCVLEAATATAVTAAVASAPAGSANAAALAAAAAGFAWKRVQVFDRGALAVGVPAAATATQALVGHGLHCSVPGVTAGAQGSTSVGAASGGPLCALGDPEANTVTLLVPRAAALRVAAGGAPLTTDPASYLNAVDGSTLPTDPPSGPPAGSSAAAASSAAMGLDWPPPWVAIARVTVSNVTERYDAWLPPSLFTRDTVTAVLNGLPPLFSLPPFALQATTSGSTSGGGGWGFGFSVAVSQHHLTVGAPGAGVVGSLYGITVNRNSAPYFLGTTATGSPLASSAGRPSGGAVYVFDLPSAGTEATAAAAALFSPHGGGDTSAYVQSTATAAARASEPGPGISALGPASVLRLVCRMTGDANGGMLGWSVATGECICRFFVASTINTSISGASPTATTVQSSQGSVVSVFAGAPRASEVLAATVSTQSRTCQRSKYIVGFSSSGTDSKDAGAAVSLSNGIGYFGSPSADNTYIGGVTQLGRLYVKTWCDPNEGIVVPSLNPSSLTQVCSDCPAGTTSAGGDLTWSAGSLCSSCSTASDGGVWLPSFGCPWACGQGLFGPDCNVCSSFMAPSPASATPAAVNIFAPGQPLALAVQASLLSNAGLAPEAYNVSAQVVSVIPQLAINSAWVDTAAVYPESPWVTRQCLWSCASGFSLNESAVVPFVIGGTTYALGLRPGISSASSTACVPPPPPAGVTAVAVLGLPGQQCTARPAPQPCFNDSLYGAAITASAASVVLFLPNSTAPVTALRAALVFNYSSSAHVTLGAPYWSILNGSAAATYADSACSQSCSVLEFDAEGDELPDEFATSWPVPASSNGRGSQPGGIIGMAQTLLAYPQPGGAGSALASATDRAVWGAWKRQGWGTGSGPAAVWQSFQNVSTAVKSSAVLDGVLWTPINTLPPNSAALSCDASYASRRLCASGPGWLTQQDNSLTSAAARLPTADQLLRAQAAVAAVTGFPTTVVAAPGAPYSASGSCSVGSATVALAAAAEYAEPCFVPVTLRLTGLRASVAYHVAMAASNAGGWGSLSPLAPGPAFVTQASTLPAQPGPPVQVPAGLSTSGGGPAATVFAGGLLNVSWDPPADFGGVPQVGLELCFVRVAAGSSAATTGVLAALSSAPPTPANLSTLCSILVVRGRGSAFAVSVHSTAPFSLAQANMLAPLPATISNALITGYAPGIDNISATSGLYAAAVDSGHGIGYEYSWPAVVAAFVNVSNTGAPDSAVTTALLRSLPGGTVVSPEGWDGNLGDVSGVLVSNLPASSQWIVAVRVFTVSGASNYSAWSSGPLIASDGSPPSGITPTYWVNGSVLAWGVACTGRPGGKISVSWGRPALTGGLAVSYRIWVLTSAPENATLGFPFLAPNDPAACNADVGEFVEVFEWGVSSSGPGGSAALSSSIENSTTVLQVALRLDVTAPPAAQNATLLAHAATSMDIFGLRNGTAYSVRIAAYNDAGFGPLGDVSGIPLGQCATGPLLPPALSPRALAPPLPELVAAVSDTLSASCSLIGNSSGGAYMVWDPSGLTSCVDGAWALASAAFIDDISMSAAQVGSLSGPSLVATGPSSAQLTFWPPVDCGGAASLTPRLQLTVAGPPSTSFYIPGVGAAPAAGAAGSPAFISATAATALGFGALSDELLAQATGASGGALNALRGSIVDIRAYISAEFDLPEVELSVGVPTPGLTLDVLGLAADSTVCVRLSAATAGGVSPWSSGPLDPSLPISAWAAAYSGLASARGESAAAAMGMLNCSWIDSCAAAASNVLGPDCTGSFFCKGPSALARSPLPVVLTAMAGAIPAATEPRMCVTTPSIPAQQTAFSVPVLSVLPGTSAILVPSSFSGLEQAIAATSAMLGLENVLSSAAMSGYFDAGTTKSSASLSQLLCSAAALDAAWTAPPPFNGSIYAPLWLQPCVNGWTAQLLARLYLDFGITAADVAAIANPVQGRALSTLMPPASVSSGVALGSSATPVPTFYSGGLVRLKCDAPTDTGGAPFLGFAVDVLLVATSGLPLYGGAWSPAPFVLVASGSPLAGDGSAALWRTLRAAGATLRSASVVAVASFGNGTEVVSDTSVDLSTPFFINASAGWGPLRADSPLFNVLRSAPLSPTLTLPPWANASVAVESISWMLPPAAVLSLEASATAADIPAPAFPGTADFSIGFGPAGEPSSVLLVGGLLANSTYLVRAAAVTAAGRGTASAVISVSTGPWAPPAHPGTPRLYYEFAYAALERSGGGGTTPLPPYGAHGPVRAGSVDLAWAAPLDSGGTALDALGYHIYAFVQRADTSLSRAASSAEQGLGGLALPACDALCSSGAVPVRACTAAIPAPPVDSVTGRANISAPGWFFAGSTAPGVTSVRLGGLWASTVYAFSVVAVGVPPTGGAPVPGPPSAVLLNVSTAAVSPPSAPPTLVDTGSDTPAAAITALGTSEAQASVSFTEVIEDGGALVVGYRVFLAAAPSEPSVVVGGSGNPGLSFGIDGSVDAAAVATLAAARPALFSSFAFVSAASLDWVAVADIIVNTTEAQQCSAAPASTLPGGVLFRQLPLLNATTSGSLSALDAASILGSTILALPQSSSNAGAASWPAGAVTAAAFPVSPGVFSVSLPDRTEATLGPRRISVLIGALSAGTAYFVRVAAWGAAPGVPVGAASVPGGNASFSAWLGPASPLLCATSGSVLDAGVPAAACPAFSTLPARVPSAPGPLSAALNSACGRDNSSSSLCLRLPPPSDLGGSRLVSYQLSVSTDALLPGALTTVAVTGGSFAAATAAACVNGSGVATGAGIAASLSLPEHSPWAKLPLLWGTATAAMFAPSSDVATLCTALSPPGTASEEGGTETMVLITGLRSNTTYFVAATAANAAGWSPPSLMSGPFVTACAAVQVPSTVTNLSTLAGWGRNSGVVGALAKAGIALPTELCENATLPCITACSAAAAVASGSWSVANCSCTSALATAAWAAGVQSRGTDFLTLAWGFPEELGPAELAGFLVSWLRQPSGTATAAAIDALCLTTASSTSTLSSNEFSACGGVTFLSLSSSALLRVPLVAASACTASSCIAGSEEPASAASLPLPPAMMLFRLTGLAASSNYTLSVSAVSYAGLGPDASLSASTEALGGSGVYALNLPGPPPALFQFSQASSNCSGSVATGVSGAVDLLVNVTQASYGPSPGPAADVSVLLPIAVVAGLYVVPPAAPVASFRSNATAVELRAAQLMGSAFASSLQNYSAEPLTGAMFAQLAIGDAVHASSSGAFSFSAEVRTRWGAAAAPASALPPTLSVLLDPSSFPGGDGASITAPLWRTALLGIVAAAPSIGTVSAHVAGVPSDAVVAVSVTVIGLELNASAVFQRLAGSASWPLSSSAFALAGTPVSRAVQVPPAGSPVFSSLSTLPATPFATSKSSSSLSVQWAPPADLRGRPVLAYLVQAAPVVASGAVTSPCDAAGVVSVPGNFSVDSSRLVSWVVSAADWSSVNLSAVAGGSKGSIVPSLPQLLPPVVSAAPSLLVANTAYALRVAAYNGLNDALFIPPLLSTAGLYFGPTGCVSNATAAAAAAINMSLAALATLVSPARSTLSMFVAEAAASAASAPSQCCLNGTGSSFAAWWLASAPAGLGAFSRWSVPTSTNPPSPPEPPQVPQVLQATSSTVTLEWSALPQSALSGVPLLYYRVHIQSLAGAGSAPPALPALALLPGAGTGPVLYTHNALPISSVMASTSGLGSFSGSASPPFAQSSGTTVLVAAGCATLYTITGLAAATQYRFAVSAVNVAGDSGVVGWTPTVTTAPMSLAATCDGSGRGCIATSSGLSVVAGGVTVRLTGVGPASGALLLFPLPLLTGGAPLTHVVVTVRPAAASASGELAAAVLVLSAADAIAAGDVVLAAHTSLGLSLPSTVVESVASASIALIPAGNTSFGAVTTPVLRSNGPRYGAFLLRGLLAATTYAVQVSLGNVAGLSTPEATADIASNVTLCNTTAVGGGVRSVSDLCLAGSSALAVNFSTANIPFPPAAPPAPVWLLSSGKSNSALDVAIMRPADLGGSLIVGYALQLSADSGQTWGGDRFLPVANGTFAAMAPSAAQWNASGGGQGAGVHGTPLRNVGVLVNSENATFSWPSEYLSASSSAGADALAQASGAGAVYGNDSSFFGINGVNDSSATSGVGLPLQLSPAAAGWGVLPLGPAATASVPADTLQVTPSLLAQWYAGAAVLRLGSDPSLAPVPNPGVPLVSTTITANATALMLAAGASASTATAVTTGSLPFAISGVSAGDGDACALAAALAQAPSTSVLTLPSWLPIRTGSGLPSLSDPSSACVHVSARITMLYGGGSSYIVRAAALSAAVVTQSGESSATSAGVPVVGAPGSGAAASAWAAAAPYLTIDAAASVLPPLASNDSCLVAAGLAEVAAAGNSIIAALTAEASALAASGGVLSQLSSGLLPPLVSPSTALKSLLQAPVAVAGYSPPSVVSAALPVNISASGPVQALSVDFLAPTLIGLSWLPPMDFGGGAPLCYRVEVALDGRLADGCSPAITATSSYNAAAGYVTALSPSPLRALPVNSSVAAFVSLFGPSDVPPVSAWTSTTWPAPLNGSANLGSQGAQAALDPAGSGSVSVLLSNGSSLFLPLAQFLNLTSQTLSSIATATASDPYRALGLPFGPGFNSSMQLVATSSSGHWSVAATVAAPQPQPVARGRAASIGSVQGLTPMLPVFPTPAAARVSVVIAVPPASMARVRVAAVTGRVALDTSAATILAITPSAATAASPARSGTRRRLHRKPEDSAARQVSQADVKLFPTVPGRPRRGRLLFPHERGGSDGQHLRRAQASPAPPSLTQSLSSSQTPSHSRTSTASPTSTPSPSATPALWVPWAPAPGAALLAPWPAAASSSSAAAGVAGAAPVLLLVTPAAPPPAPPTPVLGAPAPSSTAATLLLRSAAASGTTISSGCGCAISRIALFRAAWNASSGSFGAEVVAWQRDDDFAFPLTTRQSASLPFLLQSLQTPLTVTDGGLYRGTQYRYRVSVGNLVGWSLPSPPLLAATPAAPASAPVGLRVVTAAMLPVMVPLAWLPPLDDGGSSVSAYVVQIAWLGRVSATTAAAAIANPALNAWVTVSVSVPPTAPLIFYNVTGLQPSSTYLVQVAAITAAGAGAWAPIINVTTPDPLPCPGLPDPDNPAALNGSEPNAGRGRCSGHGTCGSWDGTCTCDLGWALPYCAFPLGLAWRAAVAVPPAQFSATAFASATALAVNGSISLTSMPLSVSIPFTASRIVVVNVTSAPAAARRLPAMADSSSPFLRSDMPPNRDFELSSDLLCSASLASAVAADEWPLELGTVPRALAGPSRPHFNFSSATGAATFSLATGVEVVQPGAGSAEEEGQAGVLLNRLDSGRWQSRGLVALHLACREAAATAATAAAARRQQGPRTLAGTSQSVVAATELVVTFMIALTAAEAAARQAAVAAAGGIVAFAKAASGDTAVLPPSPPLHSIPLDPEISTPIAFDALASTAALGGSALLASAGIATLQPLVTDTGTVLPLPLPPPWILLPVPQCGNAALCTACLASPSCGWCATTATCALGSPGAPSYVACPETVSPGAADGTPLLWGPAGAPLALYFSQQGARNTCAPECAALTGCDECTHRADCGWCEGAQACFRAVDLSSGLACGNASNAAAAGPLLTQDAQCPSLRCPMKGSARLCVNDAYCGYCDGPNTCGSGDAFGFTGSLAGQCSAGNSRYYFRTLAVSCPSPPGSVPSCSACRSRGSTTAACGWCGSKLQCGLAADASNSAPALGSCPPVIINTPSLAVISAVAVSSIVSSNDTAVVSGWFGAAAAGVCPAAPVTSRAVCAAQGQSCSTCLSAGASSGCAFCATSSSSSSGVCLLLGDAVGLPPALGGSFDATSAQRCTGALRGLPLNYSYGNSTVGLPATAAVGCPVSCSTSGVTLTSSSGVLQFGSAGDPASPVVPLTYVPVQGAVCQWIICPYDNAANGSSSSGAYASVAFTFSGWDLASGDSVHVCPSGSLAGCSALLLGSSGATRAPVQYTVDAGCATVLLQMQGATGGTGFRMAWQGQRPVFVVWKLTKRCRRRNNPFTEEFEPAETLEAAQERAARRGLAVPRSVTARFPVFVYAKDKLSQTPLRSPLRASPEAVGAPGGESPSEPLGREIVENTATQCTVCLCDFEDGERISRWSDLFSCQHCATSWRHPPTLSSATGDLVRVLPCRHAFHRDCIDPSLSLNRHCPNCRSDTVLLLAERESLLLASELSHAAPPHDPLAFGPDIVMVPPPPVSEDSGPEGGIGGAGESGNDELVLPDLVEASAPRRRRSRGRRVPLSGAEGDVEVAGGRRSARDVDEGAPLPVMSNPMQRSGSGRAAFSGSNRRIAANPVGRTYDGFDGGARRAAAAALRRELTFASDGEDAGNSDGSLDGDGYGGGQRLRHEMLRNPLHYGASATAVGATPRAALLRIERLPGADGGARAHASSLAAAAQHPVYSHALPLLAPALGTALARGTTGSMRAPVSPRIGSAGGRVSPGPPASPPTATRSIVRAGAPSASVRDGPTLLDGEEFYYSRSQAAGAASARPQPRGGARARGTYSAAGGVAAASAAAPTQSVTESAGGSDAVGDAEVLLYMDSPLRPVPLPTGRASSEHS